MSLVPELAGRSAVKNFLEEHDQIRSDLASAIAEAKALKDQLVQVTNMEGLRKRENEQLREELHRERIMARTWLGYVMSLSGRLSAIRAAITSAEGVAEQAAKAAAAAGLVESAEPEDQQQLERIVSSASPRAPLPVNQLS